MNNENSKAFTYPLSVDPMRVFLAVGRFLPAIILLCILGLAAGYLLDKKLVPEKNRHSIKNSLLKADLGNSFGTDSFKPRKLGLSVLQRLLVAPRVIQLTNEQLGTDYDKDDFESRFDIEMDYQADIFMLVSHSYENAADALKHNQAWTVAALQYGKEMQTKEVELFTDSLESDIAELQNELAEVNSNTLAITSQEVLIDQQGTSAAAGLSYEELNKITVNRQLDLNALNAQIQKYIRDIVSQSPRAERLKELQAELSTLMQSYTYDNPLVIAKQTEIAKQEELISQSMKLDPETLTEDELLEFTNTSLSSQLYIKLLELRRERFKLEDELRHYQEILSSRRENLSKMPETKFQLSNLEQRQNDLIDKLGRVMTTYESGVYYKKNLPGYWIAIESPTEEDVYHQSYVKKYGKTVAIYTLCFLAFAFLAFLLALHKEFKQSAWSTPLQAAIRLKRMPSISINTDGSSHEFRELWLTHISGQPVGKRRSLVAALGSLQSNDNALWREMLSCIHHDQSPTLVLDAADIPIDLAGTRLTPLDDNPESIEDLLQPVSIAVYNANEQKSLLRSAADTVSENNLIVFYLNAADIPVPRFREILMATPPELHVIIRWNTDLSAGLSDLSDQIDQYVSLVSPSHSNADQALSQDRILQKMFGESNGLVLIDKKPKGLFHKFTIWFENAYFEWKKSQAS